MRRLALLVLLLLASCARPVPAPVEHVPVAVRQVTGLADGVVSAVRAASRPDTAVGLLVVDRATDRALAAHEPNRPFRSASLVKLLMAVDALVSGTATREELHVMLSRSDDDIANRLWVRSGGSAMVVATAARLGLRGTRPPALPHRWGDVLMTPADVIRVYRHIAALPPADRDLLEGALRAAPSVAADGFDQHFGIPDAVSAPWAVKQGWSDSRRDLSVHTTGVVADRYVVVLLTEHPLPIALRRAAASVTEGMRVLNPVLT